MLRGFTESGDGPAFGKLLAVIDDESIGLPNQWK